METENEITQAYTKTSTANNTHLCMYIYSSLKSHLKKQSLKRGLPYLVGNQEVTPKALVPDCPPNKANTF